MQIISVSGLFDSWKGFSQDENSRKKWFWMFFLMARQKSGISMLSVQRMVNIKSYKTVWVMGHKIREAMAHLDGSYKVTAN